MSGRRQQLIAGFVVAAAYLAAARLGFSVAFVAEQVTTVWAPTGIAIAALLLWGRALWPAIWVGAFLANAGTTAPLWTAAAVACGNTLEAVSAALVLQRLSRFDPALRRLPDALAYLIAAAGISTAISATIGATTLCVAAVQPWDRFDSLWIDWWLGDAMGALVVGPLILTTARQTSWSRRESMESVLLVAATIVATQIVFGQVLGPVVATHPLEHVLFPLVITAAVRRGQPTTALVVAAASAVAIWNTIDGSGPFAGGDMRDSLILLQVFTGALAGSGLLLAAAIAERSTGERRRAAAYAVGEELGRADDLPSAAPAILQSICGHLEWAIGAIWLVDRHENRLRSIAVWADEREQSSDFVRMTLETPFEPGVGLPGRIWAEGKPAWIENVALDRNFPRAAAARTAGIRGAFGVPICLGDEVLGVVEFFNRAVVAPDPDLLQTMGTVGNQIGQFIGRKREERAAREAEYEREALLVREAAARSEAESANRAKDEFLATLSHELRTPLHAIVGWTRLLLDGVVEPDKTRRALEVIDRNAQLQARLVGDILDVSHIIAGGLRLDRRPVDLGTIVSAALDAVRPAADAKQLRLVSTLETSARLAEGDPQRLQQVVWNLLSNAVKFTASGGTVTVALVDAGSAGVRIVVADDGEGIDLAFLPHVFDRFRQADGSISRQHGGLGLGLAIVRHLVELHGGSVRAESEGPGRGSTFTVELPRH